ncbi:MAG TPA: putative metal-binding motif-containing protein, partial [Myxococcota bacterium]|nr:putative metal-binding motif-containing protein [Myxococcota bacterium]
TRDYRFADAVQQACGGADCNDLAPGVNPDAAEQCNLADDDCDGQTDEDGVCDRQPDDASGCGCAASGEGGPGAELGLLLLVGLAAVGRRRTGES